MVQLSGSSSSTIRTQQRTKRCHWPHFTWKGRPTSGGSGCVGRTREEGRALTWEDFEDELWSRFGPTECEDFDEALSRIKQVGSLREYQREFEKLGNRVRGWTQKALVGTFMGELKAELSNGIRMFKPRTLKKAINLERSQLLLLEGPIGVGNITSEEVTDEVPTEEDQGNQIEPEIMLHALTGWSAPKTMCVVAKVGYYDVVVLIDSGSTHNFCSARVASLLRLRVIPTETFPVRVVNDERLHCQGRFEKLVPSSIFSRRGNLGGTEEVEAVFIALKQAMTTTPTLAMPNFNEAFTIEIDASGDGIGAVLTQHGRPIAFMSRALSVSKRSWSTYTKEMLAIVEVDIWQEIKDVAIDDPYMETVGRIANDQPGWSIYL
ncbi:hypothetical protein F0562_030344 [Nyssa sinensis]|uniref:Retrotransposon gag domain-containing protein n=1 Tax=Nyssa sinensis TaxID=561372 RepID=A0A5J5B2H7_9ASTE|nr:hypothetical protein F0562_030344 [Nyssa sinensis]